jgi:hypothetical protein
MKKSWKLKNQKDPYPCGAAASWEDASTAADASKRKHSFHLMSMRLFFHLFSDLTISQFCLKKQFCARMTGFCIFWWGIKMLLLSDF